MKFSICLFFALITSKTLFSQPIYGKELTFKDKNKSAFEFIHEDFLKNIKGLDTCCTYAFGSVKFNVHVNDRISNIEISKGIPKFIADQLRNSILNTLYFWNLEGNTEKATIIIPIFIAPATACRVESYTDNILSSAAYMFNYQDKVGIVKRDEYSKKARSTESGIIFPILLVKGSLIK